MKRRRKFYFLTLKTHIKDKNKIKTPFPSEILHGTQNLCPQRLVKEETTRFINKGRKNGKLQKHLLNKSR